MRRLLLVIGVPAAVVALATGCAKASDSTSAPPGSVATSTPAATVRRPPGSLVDGVDTDALQLCTDVEMAYRAALGPAGGQKVSPAQLDAAQKQLEKVKPLVPPEVAQALDQIAAGAKKVAGNEAEERRWLQSDEYQRLGKVMTDYLTTCVGSATPR